MANRDIVPQYVDAAIAQLRRHDLMRLPLPRMPAAMRDHSVELRDDWIGWKPVPSTVTDADLDELESEIGLRYPPLYREFLMAQHFLMLTEAGVRFIPHPIDGWKDELREAYRACRDRIVEQKLIPLGYETFMDAGPVCLDARSQQSDGECPIVFWDHAWVGTDKEVRPMFSSTESMFRCLLFLAQHDVNFFYHDDRDDPALLPRKQELMSQFLALDPHGGGSMALDYWTTWGVKPAMI